ncbi:MAG: hypothetical protein ISP55_02250 [Flavobacteriales bacterium]|nr:hypothetical protein [Flavobacteriales bacterium]
MNEGQPAAWSAYEPWFKAWLVMAPVVALGSEFILRNARLRLAQLRADSLDVPEPEGTWAYAAACTFAFTILMTVMARLWIQSARKEAREEDNPS